MATKKGKTQSSLDAERLSRLERMRSKTSRNHEDAVSMKAAKASMDVAKMVRTRLTPQETLTCRMAFNMFANKKNSDILKTKKLWNVMRAMGYAPTPLEFEQLVKDMDPEKKGIIKSNIFLKEMERFITSYFSKPADVEKAYEKLCGLSPDNVTGAIGLEELTIAMQNMGFKLSDDPDEAEEEIYGMIEEIDSKGLGEIDMDDLLKLVNHVMPELAGES
jgi:Ca2+-binding EF-hand superfamily protein